MMAENFKSLGESLEQSLGANFTETRLVPRGIKCENCGAELQEQHIPRFKAIKPVPCECERRRMKELDEIRMRNEAEATTLERLRVQGSARRERLRELDVMPDLNSKKWRFEDYDVDVDNEAAFRLATEFCTRTLQDRTAYEVPGFGIWGEHGAGKSFLVTAVGKLLMEKGVDVAQIYEFDIADLLSRVRNNEVSFSAEVLARDLMTVPVLILEDFMKTRVRNAAGINLEYVHEFLFKVVQKRIMKSLPMVVTSNHSFFDLKNVHLKGLEFGPAILDRFAESFGCDERRWVKINGSSRRLHRA